MTANPFDATIAVADVERAEPFPEADKPEMVKRWLDFGDETRQSAAQLGYHHDAEALDGRQVLAVADLGSVRIAGFESEALTVGVPGDDGTPVLIAPEEPVPPGGELY